MRRSTLAWALLGTGLAACAGTFAAAALGRAAAAPQVSERAELVRALGLTDLALFTEARYTRHLSQADLHTPFQDHPMALDHFPSGALVAPPAHLTP